jgi:uncharacterized protein (TIGR02246 family)
MVTEQNSGSLNALVLDSDINEIARVNFQRWNDALQTKDKKKVSELYFRNATLLPTFSSKLKTSREQAEEYFAYFLASNPSGEITEEVVKLLTDTLYEHSGLYDFTVGPEGHTKIVSARFTFIWALNRKNVWKIVCHHSSVLPQEK